MVMCPGEGFNCVASDWTFLWLKDFLYAFIFVANRITSSPNFVYTFFSIVVDMIQFFIS